MLCCPLPFPSCSCVIPADLVGPVPSAPQEPEQQAARAGARSRVLVWRIPDNCCLTCRVTNHGLRASQAAPRAGGSGGSGPRPCPQRRRARRVCGLLGAAAARFRAREPGLRAGPAGVEWPVHRRGRARGRRRRVRQRCLAGAGRRGCCMTCPYARLQRLGVVCEPGVASQDDYLNFHTDTVRPTVICLEELELRCFPHSISHRRSRRRQSPSTRMGAACASSQPARCQQARQHCHNQLPSPAPDGSLSRLPAAAGVQPGACASTDGRRRRSGAQRGGPRGARHGRGARGATLRRRTGRCGPAAGSRLPGAAPALHCLLCVALRCSTALHHSAQRLAPEHTAPVRACERAGSSSHQVA